MERWPHVSFSIVLWGSSGFQAAWWVWNFCSLDHSVAFMSWWVCNDIATLGWGTLSSSTIVQVECHFFWYESVQINIMESISPSTSIGATAHVSGRARGTWANTYTSHCTTKTWGEKKKKYLGQTVKKVNFLCVAEGIKLIWLLVTCYRHFVLLLLPQVQITCSQLSDHKNLAMTQTAFYDIKTELIHQVVTALYGKC